MLSSSIIFQYVIPSLGCIISNFMFLAPATSVHKAFKEGSLGDLNPTPWACMLGTCAGWIAYSYLVQNYFIFLSNLLGFLMSLWFNLCAIKLQYQAHLSRRMQEDFVDYHLLVINSSNRSVQSREECSKAISYLTASKRRQRRTPEAPHEQFLLYVVLVWVTVISFVGLAPGITQPDRIRIVGVVVNLNTMLFFGAPLSTIWEILETCNSASIHVPLTIASVVNSGFWATYGIYIMDPMVLLPNIVGLSLGATQIFLCLLYPRLSLEKTNDDDEEEQRLIPNEVNISESLRSYESITGASEFLKQSNDNTLKIEPWNEQSPPQKLSFDELTSDTSSASSCSA